LLAIMPACRNKSNSDAERLVARTFQLGPDAGSFTARSGASVELPWREATVILRALTVTRGGTEHTSKSKKFDLGMAVATGGFKFSKTVEKTEKTQHQESEHLILVYGASGQQVSLRELSLDFSCLGKAAMQPVRNQNIGVLARLLKERAPHAFYDERLLRLGPRPLPFVSGGEIRTAAGGVVQTRSSTATGVDVLAEALRKGVSEGLLP